MENEFFMGKDTSIFLSSREIEWTSCSEKLEIERVECEFSMVFEE